MTFIHVWTYRMFSIQFSCWDSAHLIWEGTHSDVLINCCYGAWKKRAARSAESFVYETRCEMPEREVPIKPTKKKHGTFWHTAKFLEHLFGTLPKNFLEFSICKCQNYFFFCATIASKYPAWRCGACAAGQLVYFKLAMSVCVCVDFGVFRVLQAEFRPRFDHGRM